MLGWLESIIDFFGGGLSAIWHAFLSVIKTVYNDMFGRFNNLASFVNAIYAGLWRLSKYTADFVNGSYRNFVFWTENQFSQTNNREQRDYNYLVSIINKISRQASTDITIIQQTEKSDIAALIKWIISQIFGPLRTLIGQALNWITHEGAFLYDLLTHLEKLADLLIGFLWSGWLVLFRKYAPQLVKYVLHNWRAIAPDIAHVLEDIISSVL